MPADSKTTLSGVCSLASAPCDSNPFFSATVAQANLLTMAWLRELSWFVHLSNAEYRAPPLFWWSNSSSWLTWSMRPWIVLQQNITRVLKQFKKAELGIKVIMWDSDSALFLIQHKKKHATEELKSYKAEESVCATMSSKDAQRFWLSRQWRGTYLSNIHWTSKLSTSATSMFSSWVKRRTMRRAEKQWIIQANKAENLVYLPLK